MMAISAEAMAMIRRFEGCARKGGDGLMHPYKDAVGVPTIGYGTTRYPSGVRVRVSDRPLTVAVCAEYLAHDVRRFEIAVDKLVKRNIAPQMRDALVVFSYNLGAGALKVSTLLRKLNAGDFDGAQHEFGKWVYAGKGSRRRRLAGLVKRRAAEAALFGRGVVAMKNEAEDRAPSAPSVESDDLGTKYGAFAGIVRWFKKFAEGL